MSRKSVIWRDTSAFLSFSRDMTEQARGLKKLELSTLREQCDELDLKQHYSTYIRRLHTSQITSFIFILIFIITIQTIIIMVTLTSTERKAVYVDLAVCIVVSLLVVSILSINFSACLKKRYSFLPCITAVAATSLLIAMDVSIPFIHIWFHNFTVPLYNVLTLLSIYFFMPISSYLWTIIMGVTVTACYILFYKLFVYCSDGVAQDTEKLISEAIFLFCLNILGIFVRVSREVVTRMIFIDKRQCIEEKLLFYAAKDQERNLLLSMIPQQIAKQMEVDVRNRIELMKKPRNQQKTHSITDARKLFIEPHEDVTILYADIVNYTHLTTTLDVKTLVGTLHDLYVRFDDAANEFNVLRIQFLGDCYYCVANVSMPNEEHAKSCVKLGLRMINEIRAVRSIRKLEIDMRIGVHSGSVLSGVIGANKWQFDIYSRDVDIANRLESTGVPGRVHISAATLEHLEGKFKYGPGTEKARMDPILRKYQITTFLIEEEQTRRSLYQHKIDDDDELSNINSYQRLKTLVAVEMGQESVRMPINNVIAHFKHLFFGEARRRTPTQQEVINFYSNISWFFMWYKNWRWELGYMQQTDIMYKYSLCVAYILILCTIAMHAINMKQSQTFWVMVGIGNAFMLVILVLVWFKKIWSILCGTVLMTRPFKGFSLWLYKISEKLQRDLKLRTAVYLVTLLLHLCYSALQLAFTESIILSLALTFLFSHISYTLKWIVFIAISITYGIVIFVMYAFIFELSLSSNQYFHPEYVHLIYFLTAFLAFHTVTREIEFISRMDYNWKHELKRKKEHAKFTNETISILISNILPTHIVDIYMHDQLTSDLYYEEYENVAVMFATIQNFDTEMVGMRILNEIICDFDGVLGTYIGRNKVEKIKVAGWTYMAACGLNANETPFRKSRMPQRERTRSRLTILDDKNRLTKRSADEQKNDEKFGFDFVYVMTCFALDLLRCMRAFNEENIQGEDKTRAIGVLRIGISNGPIMAGVVGLYKPFYDIWGNAVNMASRMDSTGIAGSIQVNEETARILETFNVKSTFRGQTFVKGRGEIPTYFVDIDENLHFRN